MKNIRSKNIRSILFFHVKKFWAAAVPASLTLEVVRIAEFGVLPQTYWIRICIVARSPSDSHAHYGFYYILKGKEKNICLLIEYPHFGLQIILWVVSRGGNNIGVKWLPLKQARVSVWISSQAYIPWFWDYILQSSHSLVFTCQAFLHMAWGGLPTVTFLRLHSTTGCPMGPLFQEDGDNLRFMSTFFSLPLDPADLSLTPNPGGCGLVFLNHLGVVGMGLSREEVHHMSVWSHPNSHLIQPYPSSKRETGSERGIDLLKQQG